MALPFSDSMTDTNGTNITTHDSGYTVLEGACDIQSNTAQGNAAGYNFIAWTADTFEDDQSSEAIIDFDVEDAAIATGPSVRLATGTDGYSYTSTGATTGLYRFDNTSGTALGGAGSSWADTDEVRLEMVGSAVEAFLNDVSDISETDSTYTSGDAGWMHYGDATNIRIDSILLSNMPTESQAGFAFGDDSGSESAHTLGPEDTNYSGALGTKTIRFQIDALTGDPASTPYKLKYQKNATGGYVDVPVGSGGTVAPTFDSGDVFESGSNTATTTPPMGHQAHSSGDLVIQIMGIDDDDTITLPSAGLNSETLLASVVGNSGSLSGPAIGMIAWVANAGQSSSTRNWAIGGGGEQWTGMTLVIPAGEFDATTPINVVSTVQGNSSDSTNVPTPTMTTSSTAGGRVIVGMAVDVDPFTGTPTGWTAPVLRDRGAVALGIAYRDAETTATESVGSVNFTITLDTSSTVGLVVNGVTTTNEVYISTSSNVAAGGEATTARLTAPSGKSTSDFDAGRRWDDENGSDSIDITDLDYTELEWILTTQSPAADTDYFDFRVYDGDTALNTYATTPRWTIGGGGAVSGTTTITFSDAADLLGLGTLAASETVTFSNAATLLGIGPIDATESITFSETANLVGTAVLTASETVTFTPSADLVGLGTLAASETVVFSDTANLNSIGVLAASETISFSDAADLKGIGTLATSETITFTPSADLAGLGTLASSESITFSDVAGLSGTGTLAASETIVFSDAADLTAPGAGQIAANISLTFSDSATLTGRGTLQVSETLTFSDAANAVGTGTLAGLESISFTEVADLIGVASLATAETISFTDVAALTGLGYLAASESIVFTPTADIIGLAGISANESITFTPDASILGIGSGAMSGSVNLVFSDSSTLTGTGSLSSGVLINFSVLADLYNSTPGPIEPVEPAYVLPSEGGPKAGWNTRAERKRREEEDDQDFLDIVRLAIPEIISMINKEFDD